MQQESSIEQIQDFKGAYPKQIWGLFFSEMWERFCFYGMRGMLTYFMVYQLAMDSKQANLQYGATQAWVYSFTFIGGLFADKILGFRKSLFWGGLMMIIGSVLLAIDPHKLFFLGIAFNIIGTGFFKPNISSMVGQLYKDGDARRDAGFLLFYSGINIGAFLGGYVITIGKGTALEWMFPENIRWNVAFGLAAIAMTISLITFIFTKRNLGPIGLPPLNIRSESSKRWQEYAVYAGALLSIPLIRVMVKNTQYTDWFMYCIGPFSLLYLIYEMRKNTPDENKKLMAAMLFILFSIVFWAIFEQAGGSLSLFAADNIGDTLFGFWKQDPNAINNSINALFVILFAPLIGLLFIQLSKRKLEPNTVIKFGLGFLFLGAAFYLFYAIRFTADAQGVGSLNLFTFAYFVVTLGELFLSPIGLSIITKLSPARLQGFMMGMWFLASAYGQYVAGLFGASITPDATASKMDKMITYTSGYSQFANYALIAGVLLILISPLMRKLMGEVK
ncbi:MAG: peptide MFS transporter [Chitinophagaceae bacterium]|nr:peptide MFS transporter [Chitinophagaceae bacterium]